MASIVVRKVQRPARVPLRQIGDRIVVVRGLRVILDRDLAELYGVSTSVLNQSVRRNQARFPADFAFVLTAREVASLRSQIVISNGRGGRRYAPRAFTEHGVAMLSSVLKSDRAVAVNVAIMRAFVRLRELASAHVDLARQISDLEQKYDGKFVEVFGAIRRLMAPSVEVEEPRRRIGFVVDRLARGHRI